MTYVKAKGTVNPSLNPNVASEIVRGSICHLEDAEYAEENCDEDSDGEDGPFSDVRSLKLGSGEYAPELSFRNMDVIVLKDIMCRDSVIFFDELRVESKTRCDNEVSYMYSRSSGASRIRVKKIRCRLEEVYISSNLPTC